MRIARVLIPVLALVVGLLFSSSAVFAKKEYTAKEKKPCGHCHVSKAPKDGKDLTDAGKYYEKNKTLPPAK
jgi:hypothetical protein